MNCESHIFQIFLWVEDKMQQEGRRGLLKKNAEPHGYFDLLGQIHLPLSSGRVPGCQHQAHALESY